MAATRDQIMKAAIHHLNESPAASMAQLAEAVGISRATLHRHFSNRDELMLALAHRAYDQWEHLQASSGLAAATASGDPEELERAMHALLEGVIDVADEYGFGLTDERLVTHPELARRTRELEEREVVFLRRRPARGPAPRRPARPLDRQPGVRAAGDRTGEPAQRRRGPAGRDAAADQHVPARRRTSEGGTMTVTTPPVSSRRRWAGLAVLSASVLLVVMDMTVLNVALPAISEDLRPESTELLWMVDAYALVLSGLLVTVSALGDRWGRKRMLMTGFAVFGLASLAVLAAGSPLEVIAVRALLGVGGAMIMPSTLSMIRNLFTDPAERAKALGVWSAMAAVGAALGARRGRRAAGALQLARRVPGERARHGPRDRLRPVPAARVQEPGARPLGRGGHGAVHGRHGGPGLRDQELRQVRPHLPRSPGGGRGGGGGTGLVRGAVPAQGGPPAGAQAVPQRAVLGRVW
ncbi:MFS transporter [Nonomuraea rubra]|uniref:MFS transporter n=1 Tax=Nonomuraea rubra TaxID=46180 RepID=UPI0031E8B103